MAVQDLLSQDEIDALLHGVDDGAVETEEAAEPVRSRVTTCPARTASSAGACPPWK